MSEDVSAAPVKERATRKTAKKVKAKAKPKATPAEEVDDSAVPVSVDINLLREPVEKIKMLSDPTRLLMLLTLTEDGVLGVSKIIEKVGRSVPITQPSASHHLALLRASGMVQSSRAGKAVNYKMTDAGKRLVNLFMEFSAED